VTILEDVDVVRWRHHFRPDPLYLSRSLTNVTLPKRVNLTLGKVSKNRLITTTVRPAALVSLIDLL